MNQYIVFDCYQTLIYKKNLEKIVQDFSRAMLKKRISLDYIVQAYRIIYNRYKFKHPRFKNLRERENFYMQYNKELMNILGISISSSQALELNKYFKKATWSCYPDTFLALNDLQVQKIPKGVLANWTQTLNDVLEGVHLTSYFDLIHSSHHLGIEKPNPEIFIKALKTIMKKFDTIYYVGDDYELDVVPARDAGLIPILIDRNNQYPDSVDCIRIKKLTDLRKIIQ